MGSLPRKKKGQSWHLIRTKFR